MWQGPYTTGRCEVPYFMTGNARDFFLEQTFGLHDTEKVSLRIACEEIAETNGCVAICDTALAHVPRWTANNYTCVRPCDKDCCDAEAEDMCMTVSKDECTVSSTKVFGTYWYSNNATVLSAGATYTNKGCHAENLRERELATLCEHKIFISFTMFVTLALSIAGSVMGCCVVCCKNDQLSGGDDSG